VCCADSLEGGEVHAQAEEVLLSLLKHPLPGVQLAVYALMEHMVMDVSASVQCHTSVTVSV
jgi:hypothetical protein